MYIKIRYFPYRLLEKLQTTPRGIMTHSLRTTGVVRLVVDSRPRVPKFDARQLSNIFRTVIYLLVDERINKGMKQPLHESSLLMRRSLAG